MILSLIKQDCYRYSGKITLKEYFVNKGFRFVFFMRLSACPLSLSPKDILFYPARMICKIIRRYLTVKYGYEISEDTKIGGGFALVHLGGVAINPKAEIGNNCTIYKGVTIGGAWKDDEIYAPVIGDRVWIGANATIVGKIRIGNNVLIASNAFINRDVPDNSLVIGNPAMIKPFDHIDQYVQFILP